MKLAYDPWMIRNRSFDEVCAFAREFGYEGIELSPRDDFLPLLEKPKAASSSIAALQAALSSNSIELVSIWTVYRWAEPSDPAACEVAIKYFRRFIEVAGELGCNHISSEFGGDWRAPQDSRNAFLKSIQILLPELERASITLSLDAHPGDWIEDGRAAVSEIRELGSPHLRFLYSTPHSFYLDKHDDLRAFLSDVGEAISFVRIADTFDHRPLARYIVNPLGAPVRVHQHLNIGEGEIDWPAVFDGLKAIDYRGYISNSVFAWPDKAEDSARLMRRKMLELQS
jgi:myo-inositol catabolism protein IolH